MTKINCRLESMTGLVAAFLLVAGIGCGRSEERNGDENVGAGPADARPVKTGKRSPVPEEPPEKAQGEAANHNVDCGQLEKAAQAEKERINTCDSDSDCLHSWGNLWTAGPVYCGVYRNKGQSLAKLRGIVERYRAANCPVVRASCKGSPGRSRCQEGKCVPTVDLGNAGEDGGAKVDCGQLREALSAEKARVNHCEQDSECAFMEVPGNVLCPEGCWMFYSRTEDLSPFNKLYGEWVDASCGVRCRSRCKGPPEKTRCVSGKCAR